MSFLSNNSLYQYIKCRDEIEYLKIAVATKNETAIYNSNQHKKILVACHEIFADLVGHADYATIDQFFVPALYDFLDNIVLENPVRFIDEKQAKDDYEKLVMVFAFLYSKHLTSNRSTLRNSDDPLVCYMLKSLRVDGLRDYIIGSIFAAFTTLLMKKLTNPSDEELRNFMDLMDGTINSKLHKFIYIAGGYK